MKEWQPVQGDTSAAGQVTRPDHKRPAWAATINCPYTAALAITAAVLWRL
jgi:hypothetical protein